MEWDSHGKWPMVRVVGVARAALGKCQQPGTLSVFTKVAAFPGALAKNVIEKVAQGHTPSMWEELKVPEKCQKKSGLELALCE